MVDRKGCNSATKCLTMSFSVPQWLLDWHAVPIFAVKSIWSQNPRFGTTTIQGVRSSGLTPFSLFLAIMGDTEKEIGPSG